MSFSCLDSKFCKFLAGIFSTCLLPSWEFVIWWRYWWVSDFQCVISSSIIYTTFFLYKLFLLNFDNFYEHVMGNDVRKWIPNQKHTKWPHKHHNMSIKLIQKSTRIHIYNFLKEKYQFCWSNALSEQTWWKTLWKSEFALFLIIILAIVPLMNVVQRFWWFVCFVSSSVQSFLQLLYF